MNNNKKNLESWIKRWERNNFSILNIISPQMYRQNLSRYADVNYINIAIKNSSSLINKNIFVIQQIYAAQLNKLPSFSSRKNIAARNRLLSDLLPYDPAVKAGARLKNGLKEYLLLLIATEQAMTSIRQGELKNFDPLVGENACQIRALKIALIYSNCSFDIDRLLNDVTRGKLIVEAMLEDIFNLQKGEASLKDILGNKDLEIAVSFDELYLIKSYLLSKVKTARQFKMEMPLLMNECTDTKLIKEISSVGSMFADNFVKMLREKMSESSVRFVQELARELPSNELSVDMVNQFAISYRGLRCLPCYWSTKVLMRQALINRIPIVILAQQKANDRNYEIVQKTAIYFEPTSEGYRPTTRCGLEGELPALIFLGSTCREFNELPEMELWRNELLEHCPIDLILAYAATHRQYPDQSQEYLVLGVQDEEYNYHKIKADEWGCSMENASRFFLAHAFCDKIGNAESHL